MYILHAAQSNYREQFKSHSARIGSYVGGEVNTADVKVLIADKDARIQELEAENAKLRAMMKGIISCDTCNKQDEHGLCWVQGCDEFYSKWEIK